MRVRLKAFILQIISFVMVAALIVIIIVSMCGSSASSRSMSEVSPSVVSLFENENAEEGTERLFKKNYGLNAADYDAVVYYNPISNMDAEELLIVKLKDVSQADAVSEAMEARQEKQIGIYEGYAPEQLALCQNAVLDVQGNYVLYVVHADAQKIDQEFRKALK